MARSRPGRRRWTSEPRPRYAVHFVNRALVRRDWSDPAYVAGRAALDDAMVALHRANGASASMTARTLPSRARTPRHR